MNSSSMRSDATAPDLLAALTAEGLRRSVDSSAATPTSNRNYLARALYWLNAQIAESERRQSEAYLAQSVDHCDLEYRERELERESSRRRGWW